MNASQTQTFAQVKRRIKQHGQFEQIDQLCLDQIKIQKFTRQLSTLIEKCKNVQHISFTNCQLTQLSNLPNIAKLTNINLSNNKLRQEQISYLKPQIKQRIKKLNLNHNSLKSIEAFKSYKCLQQLQIEDNPVSKIDQATMNNQSYYLQLFTTLPNLRLVNRINRQGNEQLNQFNNEFQDYDNLENENNQNSENQNQLGQNNQSGSQNDQEDYSNSQPISNKLSFAGQNSLKQEQNQQDYREQPSKIRKQQ